VVKDVKDRIRDYRTYGNRRSLRLPDLDYADPRAYHLTWGTFNRETTLSNPKLAMALIDELELEASNGNILVYAYCIMPDHIHLLVSPHGEHDVVAFVQAYKSRTTRIFWQANYNGKLWQHGFYDRILRQQEDIKQVARYILDNPVRKKITDDYLTYPFSGSLVFRKEDL